MIGIWFNIEASLGDDRIDSADIVKVRTKCIREVTRLWHLCKTWNASGFSHFYDLVSERSQCCE